MKFRFVDAVASIRTGVCEVAATATRPESRV
jgi:hypothetical protein